MCCRGGGGDRTGGVMGVVGDTRTGEGATGGGQLCRSLESSHT